MSSAPAIPIVDISAFAFPEKHNDSQREVVAKEWDDAMREVGFAMVTGHGVGDELVDDLRAAMSAFFHSSAEYKVTDSGCGVSSRRYHAHCTRVP